MATDRGVPTNRETALHRAEARVAELEAAVEAIYAYSALMPGEFHKRFGEACGDDACIVCLIESTAQDALKGEEAK